ncbi:MAG: amidohydrolase [Anaerolineaceae bacterium]|nr:amidohydrolase [Anaerolineaceae bacterium]
MSFVDRVLYNGNIFTQDERQVHVTALAIGDGRILATGADEEMLALAGVGTKRENLEGRDVLPGLTDAHIHWQHTALSLRSVNVYEVPSREEALRRVAERAAVTTAGEWLLGDGWRQDVWEDRAFPTAAELDAVAPVHPAMLTDKSGHAAWVNSAALRIAGLDASSEDPPGGSLQRDENGALTGVLFETAIELVERHIPILSDEDIADAMFAAQQKALAVGLTGIHCFDGPPSLRALQILRERGQLSLRVCKMVKTEFIAGALEVGLRQGFGDDWLWLGAQKIFADGALGPRTAYMMETYEGEPDNFGIRIMDAEEMAEKVIRASAAGFASAIHAIGDRAVHEVLNVFEAARKEEAAAGIPREGRRHRIEHLSLVHPPDIPRVAEIGVIASVQPIFAPSDYPLADRYWGERSQYAYDTRTQLDLGARVAYGTDSPVEPMEPFINIHAAVTRQRVDGSPGPEGWYPAAKLTLAEAIAGYTQGPAYAAGKEHCQGQLRAGYHADLIVLDRAIHALPPAELHKTQILATMLGGEWCHGPF